MQHAPIGSDANDGGVVSSDHCATDTPGGDNDCGVGPDHCEIDTSGRIEVRPTSHAGCHKSKYALQLIHFGKGGDPAAILNI